LCVDCGYENNADVVGAINILERGYRLLACGESVQSGRLMKQEPTEATRKSSRSAVGISALYGGEDVNAAAYKALAQVIPGFNQREQQK
jgi:transposase